MRELSIRELKREDLPKVKEFTDTEIGSGYYTLEELDDVFARSQTNATMCSFVLADDPHGTIKGVRLSYPPGQWAKGKGKGLHPELWKTPVESVAYFQSLFLSDDLRGRGWGRKLAEASLVALKSAGAKAVVCHAWRESPQDSSRRYLWKLGFQTVAIHPKYWSQVDYVCPLCGKPCMCTAEEMIKYL